MNKILPFFRFKTFPNLNELFLKATYFKSASSVGLLTTFESFVGKGFRQLTSLEKLHLKLDSKPPGIKYISQGLLQLPKLSSFSLDIDFIDWKNWENLIEFTRKQKDFVYLKFHVSFFIKTSKKGKHHQTQFLECLLAILSQKPKLKYLTLTANVWPLKALLNGLGKLIDTPRLRYFEFRLIKRYYVRFEVSKSAHPSFQGLCEFLVRNRGTLKELGLTFPFLEKQEENDELSTAVAQLSQLKKLRLNIWLSALGEREFSCSALGNILKYNFANMSAKKNLGA